jgi:Flp pilus assembly protein TadG
MPAKLRPRVAGQVLVLFALFLPVLLGFAAIAIDLGRFEMDRRFLQNAADAAALAGASALIEGASPTQAEANVRAILAANFTGDPTGTAPAQPSAVPLYADGHAGEPAYMVNGILISGADVRVAVANNVPYTFARVLGFGSRIVTASAHAGTSGGLLPIAVREFANGSGPNAGAASPCSADQNAFIAFFATEDSSCLGTTTDPSSRTDPSAGSAFDPTSPDSDPGDHGPVVTILGQGAQPSGTSSFRGLVALDIRDFATTTSQVYYNGVTAGTNPNTLKAQESAYLASGGYPGPPFPQSTTPPAPESQVAITDGSSVGTTITALAQRYAVGQAVLVAVYPGYVMAVPDFTIVAPSPIMLPTSGTTANPGSFSVACNQAFSGTVSLSALPDPNDAGNPLNALAGSITFGPNPLTPTGPVALGPITTSGAPAGIYALWVRGTAGSPYLTVKQTPFTFELGSVSADFALSVGSLSATNVGDTATTMVAVALPGKKSPAFGGTVTLSLDGPMPTGLGSVTFSPSSLTPGPSASSVLSVATGTAAPGTYTLWLRATGTNGAGQHVSHLAPVTLQVAAAATTGKQQYIDIVGYALMRIAAISANSVSAYAVTPVIADPNDPRLVGGQLARLVPW